ncbi:hypothetical protein JCM17844_09260 [Iodidimonas gelatinilytica]|uniref:DUF4340 domain-containing protein n=1 Tax=Iodidimonas gelatinilytica TaxID=1236966 RepID=A0A5A7MR03_9PROT|nr:DUF4340 domain-containing protein [Iodidimonas gelatinilytica]GEQ97289.1 hypothetical protein JCM17844_09260 [Iodidimonas gelatinilytica]
MTQKQTSILGFLTLFAVLAALWLLFGESHDRSPQQQTHLLPKLSAQINDVAKIEISDALNSTHLVRENGSWSIAEKSGHEANSTQLRAILRGLADAQIALVKTDNPDLYERIGLGESALHLVLKDKADKVIVALDIGRRSFENRSFMTFVRPLDGARSYLVSGLPEIRAEASNWLDPTLFSIERRRIARIDIQHNNGETLSIRRSDPRSLFAIQDLAAGTKEKDSLPTDMLANAFTEILSEDVRPADELDETELLYTAHLHSFDGFVLTLSLYDTGDETGDAWAVGEATAHIPDEEDLPDAQTALDMSPETEATRFNRQHMGWAYRLPASKAIALGKTLEDLVENAPQDPDDGA